MNELNALLKFTNRFVELVFIVFLYYKCILFIQITKNPKQNKSKRQIVLNLHYQIN